MKIPFAKMHGLGNDFVVLDQRARHYGLAPEQLAFLADRHLGVGCDQLLSLEPPRNAEAAVRYVIFNADGSPAEHCGNGVRCVARYLDLRGEVRGGRVGVEIGDAVYELAVLDNGDVRVDMGRPRFAPRDIPLAAAAESDRYALDAEGRAWQFGAVSMGNPHAVFEVPDTASAPVATLGPLLQDHPLFPRRVNVGFMQVEAAERIRLRVFERGVGETRACGTGACAAVAVGRRWGRLAPEVEVLLTGGRLTIAWDGQPDHSLWMTGPATFVFEGTIDL
ncbi:MAG: diaminopimelate epimerase [Gammaproteobacteria bacterium]|nr:diaminopimelate epimerase [Gammaproteobacteria bacterium]